MNEPVMVSLPLLGIGSFVHFCKIDRYAQGRLHFSPFDNRVFFYLLRLQLIDRFRQFLFVRIRLDCQQALLVIRFLINEKKSVRYQASSPFCILIHKLINRLCTKTFVRRMNCLFVSVAFFRFLVIGKWWMR
jgi:hypothetical protein